MKRINARNERKTDPKEGRMAMVNGRDPARRRSCGGENGKTLRRGWDREVAELEGAGCFGCAEARTGSGRGHFPPISVMTWPVRADASN